VLYYHAVKPRQRHRFARQMDHLLRGSAPFQIGQLKVAHVGIRTVAVTFDDGFRSVVENAVPELSDRGIPFTVFVPSGSLGVRPTWVLDPTHPSWEEQVVSASELRALTQVPLATIGSHSISHPNLLRLDPARSREELAASKAALEAVTGKAVDLFSFPHGAHDAALIDLARIQARLHNHAHAHRGSRRAVLCRASGGRPGRLAPRIRAQARRCLSLAHRSALEASRGLKAMGLPGQLTVDVDQIDESGWSSIVRLFSDANVYQTWAYGAVSWGEEQLSHLVLRRDGQPVAATQVRVVRVPVVGSGIAYVRWGPMCQRHGQAWDPASWSAISDALIQEYVVERRLVLRIVPSVFVEDPYAGSVTETLGQLGFAQAPDAPKYQTIRVNLRPPVEALRQNLSSRWRRQLNISERNNLEIVEGQSDKLYDEFLALYREMYARKQFETSVDPEDFKQVQQRLPADQKMSISICRSEGRPVASLVVGTVGNTAIYLLAATGDEGLNARGSYALQWRAMQRLKEMGCTWYDLGGVNAEVNPGVFTFKSGMGGDNAGQLGRYQLDGPGLSRVSLAVGERAAGLLRRLRTR
jgi:peptidoglycan/xylan/chitin deacetylase (PgdA/CDA1 family)